MLKKIIAGVAIFLGALLVIVATIWTFPHLVLTRDRVYTLVESTFGEHFSKTPRHLELKIRAHGWNGKRITLQTDRFCLKNPNGCFEKVNLELAFKWVGFTRFRIDELGPMEIVNESLTLGNPDEPEKPDEEKPSRSWTDFVEIPAGMKLQSVRIVSPKIVIDGRESTIEGSFQLSGEDVRNIRLKAIAKSNDGLKAHLEATTGFVGGTKTPFHAIVHAKQLWSIDGDLRGDIQWDTLFITLAGKLKATRLAPWLHTLELQDLRIQREQNLHLATKVFLKIEPKLSFAERDSALPKASYSTEVRGNFDIEETAGKDGSTYDYTLKLGPGSRRGLFIDALLKGTYPFPKGEEYRYGMKEVWTEIKIPEFQSLVKNFRNTNAAVPAPFASLRGPILFQIGKKGAATRDVVPLLFKTDLTGSEQSIVTSSNGNLLLNKSVKNLELKGKTELKKIVLTLPEVDPIKPPPALKRDPRILSLVETEKKEVRQKKQMQQAEERKKSGSSFDLNWEVTTPSPILIYYSLCSPNIPLEVNLALKTDGNSGKIKVLPLDIHYLHRDAHVDYFTYYLEKNRSSVYDGRLVVKKTDYTILIDIMEKEGSPKIVFSSEPPLSEDDIISVLLFNQTTAQLSPDETNSVSNTQSAIANRALGLFSIFALSSTPIEAVSYNAASGVYAARVRLAEGLTATVGTDWENTQEVALRKRIGKNFVLSTIFGQDDEDEHSTKTLLEWFRRF